MAQGTLNAVQTLRATIGFDVYTKPEVDALLDEKADKTDTYTKAETNSLLDDKADKSTTYTKTEVDNALSLKANSADVYTKTEADNLLSNKADKATTLAGYGITDAYTKTQTDTLLNGKADADSVYTKQEIDTKIPSSVGSATKPVYVNGGVVSACTHELNKTVPANAVFTDTTYTAGNGLNLSGTSFSAKAGTNVTVDGNGINVNGNGVVASADSGLINGGTAYTELRPTLDGTWVKNAQTTATNLQKLEGGIEYLYGLLSHQYDQLKKYINGNYYDYDTDTDSKYAKTVPQGAMPYASLDSIGGKTVAWNQLRTDTNQTTTQDGITTTYDSATHLVCIQNDSRTTNYSSGSIQVKLADLNTVKGHKYLITFTPQGSGDSTGLSVYWMYGYAFKKLSNFNAISEYTNDDESNLIRLRVTSAYDFVNTHPIGNKFYFYVNIVDLTLCYGAGNEPSTVAEFQQMFPASYYSYNAGTLLSAGVTEVVSKGKNLFDSTQFAEHKNYRSYTVNPYGDTMALSISDNDTSVSIAGMYLGWCNADYNANASGAFTWLVLNGNINFPSKYVSSTLPNVVIYPKTAETLTALMQRFNIQIEFGSTATTYSPYHAPIITPIPTAIQALEGYGWSAGSVFNYIDCERKVFVKCVDRVDLGRKTWTASGSHYYTSLQSYIKENNNQNIASNILCQKYVTKSFNDLKEYTTPCCSMYPYNVQIYDSAYADATALKTALDGVYLYYELATPVETDISAYLTDDNLISVEAGGTLTFENSNGDDYRIPIPSSETYMVDLQASL